ncbi:3',5'-cyclic adenosine monophosphate phosphodiesterase CpdA [Psychromonas marina]|uniref:3',5'-cyclic adenosine monophosphate phosphodiesterase CpdA n=1 Tax=Psychromonas marina TaxID=88364 RepID=A0ABQ6DZB3_9GAMM|nr:phosphodiesterase [Psychromonas marina]GLS90432.1 3',5'-cyclic adenosine monophosphate phosphodiesterase CpdA [Psychromonas marina]
MLIAQLTDLHIKKAGKHAYKKVDTLACLEKAISHINALVPCPDLVVITGDLGDFGTIDEYELISKALYKFTMPVHIVPGNHDNRDNLRQVLGEMTSFDHAQYCNFVVDHPDQVLIGLDSSVIGESHGYLSEETLFWLNKTLEIHKQKSVMLFIHHPPMPVGLGHMDVQNLHNAGDLYDILKRFDNVNGLVAGHLHRPISALWNKIPVWVGPSHSHSVTLDLKPEADSSFSLEPAAIRLFILDQDTVISHLSYIDHSDGPYPFFDQLGNLID